MKKAILLSFIAAAAFPEVTFAAGTLSRAWVAATRGSDIAGCGLSTNPCKTFQYAYDNSVAVNGSILVLEAGGYGPVTITSSISIINDAAGTAGVFTFSPSTGNGIDINLASGGNVLLKGLAILDKGNFTSAINMTSGGSLTMIDCTITGFSKTTVPATGVNIRPSSGVANVSIHDSTISENRNGVVVAPGGSADANIVVRNTKLMNNLLSGFFISGNNSGQTLRATIEDSIVGNNTVGIQAQGASSDAPTRVIVKNVNASFNKNFGFRANAGSSVSITNSLASGNATDVSINSGAVATFHNNIFGQSVAGMNNGAFQ